MPEYSMALVTAGAVLCFAFPVLLLIFGVLFAWTAPRNEMNPATRRVGVGLIGTGLLGVALYVVGGVTHLLILCWASVAMTIFTAVLGGLFLRGSLKRPLRAVSWVLLTDTVIVAAFLPFAVWIAVAAQRSVAYSNFNEVEVQAALRKNPNDPAAHSSMARIDSQNHNSAGAIAEWRQVLSVEPDNEDALFRLARELDRAHRPDEARPLYQKVASRNGPYHDRAQERLARYGK